MPVRIPSTISTPRMTRESLPVLALAAATVAAGTLVIAVLSAREAEPDKVAALETGADDYVTKPFGLPELRARIGALLRRAGGIAADPTGRIELGPVTIDVARRAVTVDGVGLDLTPREYELLKTMLSQPGRLLTRWSSSNRRIARSFARSCASSRTRPIATGTTSWSSSCPNTSLVTGGSVTCTTRTVG